MRDPGGFRCAASFMRGYALRKRHNFHPPGFWLNIIVDASGNEDLFEFSRLRIRGHLAQQAGSPTNLIELFLLTPENKTPY